ncbi:MAG: hypothetical protein R3324_05315 [Halobacteriales archaeon]|nr:hypothetical protein [Halobacteriales archaeon]
MPKVPSVHHEGDRGQIIDASPAHRVVIVRDRTDSGIPLSERIGAFSRAFEGL